MPARKLHSVAAALLLLQLVITCTAAAAVPRQLDAASIVPDGAGEEVSWQSARRQMLAATPQVRMEVVRQQIISDPACT